MDIIAQPTVARQVGSVPMSALEQENSRLRAKNAYLQQFKEDVIRITQSKGMDPVTKVIYVGLHALRIDDPHQPAYNTFPNLTDDLLGSMFGIGKGTASKVVQKLSAAELARRRVEHAVNAKGEYRSSSTLFLARIPEHLPSVTPSKSERRAREREAEKRAHTSAGLKELEQLKKTACPNCGTIGDWVCASCGCSPDDEPTEEATTDTQTVSDSALSAHTESIGLADASILSAAMAKPEATDDTDNKALRGGEQQPLTAHDLAGEPATPEQPAVVTGAAIIHRLATEGASFTLAYGGTKIAIGEAWLTERHSAAEALNHLARGGNVGLRTGELSSGLIACDVDYGLPTLLQEHPELATAPRITRPNAPDRGKILVHLPPGEQAQNRMFQDDDKQPTRKIEVIGNHHIIVAGRHDSGAILHLENADNTIPTLGLDQVLALCQTWAGAPAPATRPPPLVPKRVPPLGGGSYAEKVDWWIQEHLAEVESAIASRPHSRGFIAVRDEQKPSTRFDRDNYHRTMATDFGDRDERGKPRHKDLYQLYIEATGLDKREHFRTTVVREWYAAHPQRGES